MIISQQLKEIFRPIFYHLKFFINKRKYRNKMPQILTIEETLHLIYTKNISISRYGDGELTIMNGGNIGFCNQNSTLKQRLQEVILKPTNNHISCLPPMIVSLKGLTKRPKTYWKNILAIEYPLWFKYINPNIIYGNAFISRFYMDYQDPIQATKIINLWKHIWDQKNCIIVEGVNTRMGMGNDLFSNTKSISRILCPPTNAIERYLEILSSVRRHYNNQLILIALGPVATILAYDLCKLGIQALDIGHLDIEYEWFLKRATQKINISTKAVNEYKNGGLNVTDDVSESYLNQIIERIY